MSYICIIILKQDNAMYNKDALIQQVKQLLAAMRRKTAEVENFLKLIEGEEVVNLVDIQNSVSNNILSQIKDNDEHPHYPIHENILSKFRYFDEVVSRVWMIQEFKDFVSRIELKKADKTLKNLNQRIIYSVSKGEMFVMKYNNSNKYAFYAAHPEWVEKKGKGYRLIVGKEPEKSQIAGLTIEQKNPDKIIWKGINM